MILTFAGVWFIILQQPVLCRTGSFEAVLVVGPNHNHFLGVTVVLLSEHLTVSQVPRRQARLITSLPIRSREMKTLRSGFLVSRSLMRSATVI